MSTSLDCLLFSAVSPPPQLGGLSVSVGRPTSGPRSPSSPSGPFYENKDVMQHVGSPSSPSSPGDDHPHAAAVRFAHSDSVESNTDHGEQHSRDVRLPSPPTHTHYTYEISLRS